jgi:IclR family transcriptional regulator, acetate operon repressor
MLEETGSSGEKPRVQSVARAMEILFEVARSREGLSAKEIVDRTNLPKQATYHLLHTLATLRMLGRTRGNKYVLGFRVATLAESFRRQLAPPEHLAPFVRRVAEATGETSYVAGWVENEIVTLAASRGENAVQTSEVLPGLSADAHARASGKLLLSYVPDQRRIGYLAIHPLTRRTRTTLTDLEKLEAEFSKIREQGYSLDDEEFTEGVCCLAVPIDEGNSPFSLALSAPADRFRRNFDRYLKTLREIASDVTGSLIAK